MYTCAWRYHNISDVLPRISVDRGERKAGRKPGKSIACHIGSGGTSKSLLGNLLAQPRISRLAIRWSVLVLFAPAASSSPPLQRGTNTGQVVHVTDISRPSISHGLHNACGRWLLRRRRQWRERWRGRWRGRWRSLESPLCTYFFELSGQPDGILVRGHHWFPASRGITRYLCLSSLDPPQSVSMADRSILSPEASTSKRLFGEFSFSDLGRTRADTKRRNGFNYFPPTYSIMPNFSFSFIFANYTNVQVFLVFFCCGLRARSALRFKSLDL